MPSRPWSYIIVLLWLWRYAFAQVICPFPTNNTMCTSITRNPARNLKCGVPGITKHPDKIQNPCASPSFEDCRDSCVLNPDCRSFSFNQRNIMNGICTLFGSSLVAQGFRAQNDSNVDFWNHHCFKKSCAELGCPSGAFQLQASGGTQYDGNYITRNAFNADFTTDITMAPFFMLDSDCHIVLNNFPNIIGNDFNMKTIQPGPLYFTNNETVAANNYTPAICNLSKHKKSQLTCRYSNATSNQFFSCQGSLSLPGPYLGDATCGAGNGNVTLTAINFH